MTNGRRWCETRKAEATLDAYLKYARQDNDLRDEALHIGAAIVRLKWRLKQLEKDSDDVSVWEARLETEGLATLD